MKSILVLLCWCLLFLFCISFHLSRTCKHSTSNYNYFSFYLFWSYLNFTINDFSAALLYFILSFSIFITFFLSSNTIIFTIQCNNLHPYLVVSLSLHYFQASSPLSTFAFLNLFSILSLSLSFFLSLSYRLYLYTSFTQFSDFLSSSLIPFISFSFFYFFVFPFFFIIACNVFFFLTTTEICHKLLLYNI